MWLLTVSTNLVLKLLGVDPNEEDDELTEDEIRMMIDAGSEKGAIEEGEKELLQNVFEFNDIAAEDILTHRTMVDMLWTEETDAEWETTIKETNHSHYPVCGDTADDVVGVLKARLSPSAASLFSLTSFTESTAISAHANTALSRIKNSCSSNSPISGSSSILVLIPPNNMILFMQKSHAV